MTHRWRLRLIENTRACLFGTNAEAGSISTAISPSHPSCPQRRREIRCRSLNLMFRCSIASGAVPHFGPIAIVVLPASPACPVRQLHTLKAPPRKFVNIRHSPLLSIPTALAVNLNPMTIYANFYADLKDSCFGCDLQPLLYPSPL